MEYIDPAGGNARPASRWQAGALLLVLAFLFISSLFSLRSAPARKANESARLYLDGMSQARQAYALRHIGGSFDLPEIERQRQSALKNLAKLTAMAPSENAIRRLALLQYALGDP